MKRIIFWLFSILEFSGLLFGIVAALSFVAGLICWGITGNSHSIFEEILEFSFYGLQVYCIWFIISGLISFGILCNKNK